MTQRAADILRAFMEPETRNLWFSFRCIHGRHTDLWVSEAELARIRAGVKAGTIEVRDIRDKAGTISQWRTVTL